jgi:hypothetical protein
MKDEINSNPLDELNNKLNELSSKIYPTDEIRSYVKQYFDFNNMFCEENHNNYIKLEKRFNETTLAQRFYEAGYEEQTWQALKEQGEKENFSDIMGSIVGSITAYYDDFKNFPDLY